MTVTLKDKTGQSLKGTLALPEESPPAMDKISIFKDLVQEITAKAAQKSKISGMQDLGFEPSKVPGSTFANIMKTVREQKTRGIADIYTSTINLIDEQEQRRQELVKMQKDQAYKQLNLLSQNNALANLDDNSLRRLAIQSEMDFD